jgi:hypothetical protein
MRWLDLSPLGTQRLTDSETTTLAPEGINKKNLPGTLSTQGVNGPKGFSHVRNRKKKSNRGSPHFSKHIRDDEPAGFSTNPNPAQTPTS